MNLQEYNFIPDGMRDWSM